MLDHFPFDHSVHPAQGATQTSVDGSNTRLSAVKRFGAAGLVSSTVGSVPINADSDPTVVGLTLQPGLSFLNNVNGSALANWSIAAWVRYQHPAANATAATYSLIQYWNVVDQVPLLSWQVEAGYPQLVLQTDSNSLQPTTHILPSSTLLAADTWHHLVLSFQSGAVASVSGTQAANTSQSAVISMYVNGSLSDTLSLQLDQLAVGDSSWNQQQQQQGNNVWRIGVVTQSASSAAIQASQQFYMDELYTFSQPITAQQIQVLQSVNLLGQCRLTSCVLCSAARHSWY